MTCKNTEWLYPVRAPKPCSVISATCSKVDTTWAPIDVPDGFSVSSVGDYVGHCVERP